MSATTLLAKGYPAISIRPAWAWAICHAGKRIENRTWTTRYRGMLWIHASGAAPASAEIARLAPLGMPTHPTRSALVAICRLVDIVDISSTPLGFADGGADAVASDPWAVGPRCWIIEDVEILPEPIPMAGALSLWWPR